MNVDAAAAYSERRRGEALLIVRDGTVVHERYAPGYDPESAHALYSGTKSFWGVCAGVAREDGLLRLDETVGETFPSWSRGERAAVTVRELLSLTSGIGFGGLGGAVPTYERALGVELEHAPGSTFTYGGIPLQIFGAILSHKLRAQNLTPQGYLRAKLLAPIGCEVSRWRSLADGTQPLPTGAFLTARAWARFGALIAAEGRFDGARLASAETIGDALRGSVSNPHYGLGWWLDPLGREDGVVYASGSGGQAMYVLRSERTVVVRLGAGGSFDHKAFLRSLLDGRTRARSVTAREP